MEDERVKVTLQHCNHLQHCNQVEDESVSPAVEEQAWLDLKQFYVQVITTWIIHKACTALLLASIAYLASRVSRASLACISVICST